MRLRNLLLILSMVFISYTAADAGITVGKGDFSLSIGDYDYLPFLHQRDTLPRVSFYNMMSQYGDWVYVSQFGRAWKPYVYYDWQPYIYGHWSYTSYGPTWVGYEPWAWAAYHYGNWIYTQNYGWVWLPGYDWHPGRVVWAYSYNSIGWSPAPPQGYSYVCGYLCHERQTYNAGYNPYDYQFEDYNDYSDYSQYDNYDNNYDYNNRPYNNRDYSAYDPYSSYGFRYEPYFYNAAYIRVAPRLWTFIPASYFNYDDYSEIYFDPGFVSYLFQQRLVRVNERGLQRAGLEQIVHQRITEEPVRVLQLQTDRQPLRVVVLANEEEKVRMHANKAVKEVILPAFVEKRKAVRHNRMDQNEARNNAQKGQVQTLDENSVMNDAKRSREQRRAKRQQMQREGIQTIEKADREGKLENLKRDRQNAEQKNRDVQESRNTQDQNRNENQNQRNENQYQKKSVPPERPGNGPNGAAKFDRWKQRETTKFTAWKEKQMKDFENWKQENQNQPDEIKRAESDFQQKMKRAEDQFQQRIQKAEQQNKNQRS